MWALITITVSKKSVSNKLKAGLLNQLIQINDGLQKRGRKSINSTILTASLLRELPSFNCSTLLTMSDFFVNFNILVRVSNYMHD